MAQRVKWQMVWTAAASTWWLESASPISLNMNSKKRRSWSERFIAVRSRTMAMASSGRPRRSRTSERSQVPQTSSREKTRTQRASTWQRSSPSSSTCATAARASSSSGG
jgi:hypothetical protein